ncbi:MAG: PEP-CTERM sorting domain-containing protein [Akkermansia sp.]
MKRTIVALMTLAGVSSATEYTTVNSSDTEKTKLYYNGITLNLSGTRLTTSPAFTDTTVELVTFTTEIRSVTENKSDGNQAQGIKLALTTSAGLVQAVSTNTITAVSYQTWNFENTFISTNEQLYFMFVDAGNTSIETGYTLQTSDLVRAGGYYVRQYADTSDYQSLTYLGNNVSFGYNMNEGVYTPTVSIVTRDIPSVPEPATATLSLLALAGLAARRRRK